MINSYATILKVRRHKKIPLSKILKHVTSISLIGVWQKNFSNLLMKLFSWNYYKVV